MQKNLVSSCTTGMCRYESDDCGILHSDVTVVVETKKSAWKELNSDVYFFRFASSILILSINNNTMTVP